MERNLSSLLSELGETFEKSDIKKYCAANGYHWYYSLVTSTLETDRPLIIGFNWGAEKGYKYKPQNKIERSNFLNEKVGSLSRISPYCREHFDNDFLSKTSQTNYCFFRSETESQLSKKARTSVPTSATSGTPLIL